MHKALVELQKRGLIRHSTELAILSNLIEDGKAVYCGFDPTAFSLHVGSLLPLMVMKILKDNGVPVIALVGGSTGRIGDPSFKSAERPELDTDKIIRNTAGISAVIRSFLGSDVPIVDNYEWTKDITVLDFLQKYGKCFTVNNMIAKDSVRSRIERADQGISFTEFTYQILQGLDFEHLFENMNCAIQIGGSDQWGNMISGMDLIHKIHGNEAECGVITIPLLTKSDGTKFGKSESGTVWLNPSMTTPFEMYQFWLNITDEEMLKMYKYFQPLSFTVDAISLEMQHNAVLMKKQFASAMTELVHGIELSSQAHTLSSFLFGEKVELNIDEINMLVQSGTETFDMYDIPNLVDLMVQTELAASKKMAREFIRNGAAKFNGRKINEFYNPDSNEYITDSEILDNRLFVLQRGRHNYIVVKNNRI